MAYYNLKKKPALTTKEGETETMYADIVYNGTITAERLIRMVAKRTGFKEGVIEGILTELKDDVLQCLGEGYRVELGEFGFFSAKVKAAHLVANKNDIRSESVTFNGVNFRASKSFREGVRGDLERRKCVDFNTSQRWDREPLKKFVLNYIGQHGFITRTTYTQLTGRLKNTALADLKSFVSEGVLKREGRGNQMHFVVPRKEETEEGQVCVEFIAINSKLYRFSFSFSDFISYLCGALYQIYNRGTCCINVAGFFMLVLSFYMAVSYPHVGC